MPQVPVSDPPPPLRVRAGYLLHRHPIVKHAPHPLEVEMGYLLDREHQRYSRHEAVDSATTHFTNRGQSIDVLNRTDAAQIRGNFFGLELYQDAMKVVLQRYKPEPRITPLDMWSPANLDDGAPPPRHSLQRKLDDYLYLIVQETSTGRWTIPHTPRADGETMRMAVDRGISSHHADGLDCYLWSNAPQATVLLKEENTQLFIFSATYLTGRPHFPSVEPTSSNHAWVTRHEMLQYRDRFKCKELLDAILDISVDGVFETQ